MSKRDEDNQMLDLSMLHLSGMERMSTRDWVYYALLKAIIRGQLAPGSWLSENMLSTQLEVSRTPLREAFQRLQSDLLIERGLNGKLYVRNVSIKEARDLYSLRASLETLTIEEASKNMTEARLIGLRETLEQMRLAVDDRENVAEGGRDFHDALIDIANNEMTSWVLGQLQPHIDRYRYFSTRSSQDRQSQAVAEHEEIYEALSASDVGAARRAMRRHIDRGRDAVLRRLAETQGEEI